MFDSFHHSAAHPLVHPLTATGIALMAFGGTFFVMARIARHRFGNDCIIPAAQPLKGVDDDDEWVEPESLGPMRAWEYCIAVIPTVLGMLCVALSQSHAIKPQSIKASIPAQAISAACLQLCALLIIHFEIKRPWFTVVVMMSVTFGVYFVVKYLAPVLGWHL